MNINQIMKQAQAMQKKLEESQAKLAEAEFEGTSGGGMVKATISGKGVVKKLKIDAKIIDQTDPEMLEDLVIAALNEAKKKADDSSSSAMSELTGGLNIPGLNMKF
jgi:nucleoid-associated protein EbfC